MTMIWTGVVHTVYTQVTKCIIIILIAHHNIKTTKLMKGSKFILRKVFSADLKSPHKYSSCSFEKQSVKLGQIKMPSEILNEFK